MEREKVADHYNAHAHETQGERFNSNIYHMRNFNNWLKHVLISLHTLPGHSALDLCCGKGGDFFKFFHNHCHTYVGCDIATVSVAEAVRRWNQNRRAAPFRPTLLTGDCFEVRLGDYLDDATRFDIVSCQFSMHYAFESEKRVRRLLQNVTDRLKPGGFFVGTTIDANVLVRKLRAIDGLELRSKVYNIVFDETHADKKFDPDQPYGIRYTFTLDQNVNDCPEFLVHLPNFTRLAEEYDLELVLRCNFHDFYSEFASAKYPAFREKFVSSNVVDPKSGTISADEWDAIYLYTAFAFRRRGEPDEHYITSKVDTKRKKYDWEPLSEDEIIVMK